MAQTEEMDADGFTAAERAYFSSQGANTDGLGGDDDSVTPAPDAVTPDPAIDNGAVVDAAKVDAPYVDPFDDLDKTAKTTKDKSGRVIPEANFRAVSEKYKATKGERDTLKQRLDALEGDSKAAREELARERELRTRIDERLKLFNEVIAPQATGQQPAAPPNPEEDIFGYVKWQNEQIEALKGQIGQTSQTLEDTTADAQMRSAYTADAQRFMGQTPDFAAAYNYMNKVRDANLARLGYKDPNQRAQIRMDEERGLVQQALQNRLSPAELIYGMAQDWGYQKAAPVVTPAPAVTAPAATNGATAPSVTEEIDRIAKGQLASKSLSSAGGSPAAAMTVEQLANMSEEDFEKYARKNPKLVEALMGG
jgi:hypothetical protein